MRPHLSDAEHQAHLESLGIHTETEQIEISTEEIEIGTNEVIKTELSDFIIQEDTNIKTETIDGSETLILSEEEQDSDAGHDSDYENGGDKSRNSLPHKKRIPRKLKNPKKTAQSRNITINTYKCSKCNELFDSPNAFAAHKQTHLIKRPYQTNVTQTANSSFSCELCYKVFTNQWKFFEHLKSHYEPIELDSGSMKKVMVNQNKPNLVQSDMSAKKEMKFSGIKVRNLQGGTVQTLNSKTNAVGF